MMYYYVYETENKYDFVRIGSFEHVEDAELFVDQHPELPVPGQVLSIIELNDAVNSGRIVL